MSLSEPSLERVVQGVLSALPPERKMLPVALERLNGALGYLPRPAIEAVARHFRRPAQEVYGLATFYALWQVGEKAPTAVDLCDDGPCHAQGAPQVRRALEEAGLEVRRTSCLGHCAAGPVARHAGRLYRNLSPQDLRPLLEGREPAPWKPEEDILDLAVPKERALLRNVGRIVPDSLAEAVAAGAYQALRKALTGMQPAEVVEEVVRSGLQGRGGAGFPTGLKMRFTAAATRSGNGPAWVIGNADESEPGTFKDRLLIEGDPHRLLEGIVLAAYAVGAREGCIYIRGEYASQAALLERAIQEAQAAGYLGANILGTDFTFTLHLHRGAGAYICGEETALLESLEGKRGEPRLRPPYPTTYGAFGRPTLLNNVETLCNLPDIVAYGAEWYRQVGTEKSPGTKLYPISGHVRRRGCLEAPLGRFTLRQVIEGPAGGMRGPAPFKACHLGGAAGAIVGPEFLDVPLDFASCAEAGAMLGAGDLVILDAQTCLVDYVRAVAAFFRAESCGKCTPCRVGTERQLQLLNELTSGHGTPGHLQELLEWGEHMTDSSFCGLGQTASTAVLTALRRFPSEFEAHARGVCPAGVCPMRG